MKSFTIELVSKACAQPFPDNTLSSFTNFLPEQLNLEGHREVASSEKSNHHWTKMLPRENLCFLTKDFQSHQNSITWNLVFTLPLRILLKPWTFSFKKDTITARTVSKLKCLEELKKLRFTFQMKDMVWNFFSTDLGHIFGSNVGNEFEVWLRGKGPRKPESAYDIVRNTLSHVIQRPDWVQYRWRRRKLHCCVAFFLFEAQVWIHYNYWTVHELPDI